MKLYFDEILLAYRTLYNDETREDYECYIAKRFLDNRYKRSSFYNEEENPEIAAERERKKQERRQKRKEFEDSALNEDYFSSW